MSQGDRSAVDVDLFSVQAELFFYRQVLWGKGLVDLDEVHIFQCKLSLLKGSPDRGSGTNTHDIRLAANDGPRNNAPERLDASLFSLRRGSQYNSSSSIRNAACISSCNDSILFENRLQRRESFYCGFRPRMFILF